MKTCTRCGQEKPLDQFYAIKSGRRAGKYVGHCKPCDRELWSGRRYGLTREQFDTLLEEQGGVCAICRKPESLIVHGRVRALSIDHDHSCCPGKRACGSCVRGLVCNDCNSLLARSHDDPSRLRAAAEYLDRSRSSGRVH